MKKTIALVALAALTLTGCAEEKELESPKLKSVTGTVTVSLEVRKVATKDHYCETHGGYTDIRKGGQVTLLDNDGKTLALGTLENGKWLESGEYKTHRQCAFKFAFSDFEPTDDFYTVDMGKRGQVRFESNEMKSPLELTIG